jgi:acyl-CoA synthetase (AMP-forming)/AMP-acid ligase II
VLALADRRGPWLHVHRADTVRAWDGPAILALSLRWSRALRQAGVCPGDRVLILLPNDERFVAAFFGAVLTGATPVPLPWPTGEVDPALRALAPRLAHAAARAVVTVPELVDRTPWGVPVVCAPADDPASPQATGDPTDPAFLQYTSGSLGHPRGAIISHRAAVASAWSMGRALSLGPDDCALSWLPLFHDMGLVGTLLCPLITGFPLHLMRPGEFLLHPGRWLRLAADCRATVLAAPDFAWRLVLRRVSTPIALPFLRHALDGAEPVHRSTMEGLRRQLGIDVKPVYGLAENTLGVSFSTGDDADIAVDGRAVVSVGRPIPGMTVRVVDGEIRVRGPSLMSGYFRDEASTDAALGDGWLHTGDLGAIADGRLYVTGREKDLVIQNGSKFHPYDIERVAGEVAQAPPNGAAAFAHPRTESLIVVVESRLDDVDRRVRAELSGQLGVRADRVITVRPGQIPRTSSGKVQRRLCVNLWADAP